MSNANANDNLTIGKYRLGTCIATGQHSQVWDAVDNETTRRCAIKLLLPEALADPDALSTLKHEFKVGSSMDHPNIIKYYELSAKRKLAYFAMELFPAPNLKAHIFNDLRTAQLRAKRLIELVALALEQIHDRGWLHRDIKPDNILMSKSAEVRLIDFSLASRSATALSKMFTRKQATVQGTRTYMAPEQILGKPLSPQTDIYSLGVTLFEILAGQPPFAGSTPKALLLKHLGEPAPSPSFFNPNITEEMDRIVLRMLAKKPESRQRKMAEFLAEFRNVSIFKEALSESVELTEAERAKQELERTLGERLNSRTDALRSKFGGGSAGAPGARSEAAKKPVPRPAAPQRPAAPPAARQPYPPPQFPSPMMPMPMHMAPPGMPMPQMPMAPYPMAPMPPMPQPQVAMPVPMINPATGGAMPWVAAPAAPPPGPKPSPSKTLPATAPPAAAPRPAAPPAQAPAAARTPASPAKKPAGKPPAPPAQQKPNSEEQGMKIDDLPGFDSLPSA